MSSEPTEPARSTRRPTLTLWLLRAGSASAAFVAAALAVDPITARAAELGLQLKLSGSTLVVSVQLVHDLAPLIAALLVGLALAYVHRLGLLAFVALMTLLLAAGELALSPRTGLVLASWQSLRLFARLSAVTFALTLAAYFDTLPERRTGPVRTATRSAVTFALGGIFLCLGALVARWSSRRATLERTLVAAGLARLGGVDVVFRPADALVARGIDDVFSLAPKQRHEVSLPLLERLALAAALPAAHPVPPLAALLREPNFVLELGGEPLLTRATPFGPVSGSSLPHTLIVTVAPAAQS